MEYVRKICPICQNEFIVLDTVEEKAVYCTIKCLMESQADLNKNALSFLKTQNNFYGLH